VRLTACVCGITTHAETAFGVATRARVIAFEKPLHEFPDLATDQANRYINS
jgi:hypothetical protein